MIFLNNTFLTNKGNPFGGSRYDRGCLGSFDKVDIYKYSLASLAKIYPWKKAIIYFTVADDCKHREQELIEFINKEFSHTELVLRTSRNEIVQDWIDTYELLNDELIWFYCNDDHIFLDSDTDYLYKYVEGFRENYKDDLCSIYFSHWPELLRFVVNDGVFDSFNDVDAIYGKSNVIVDSIQIITKNLYKQWWVDGWDKSHLDVFLPRADHVKCLYNFKKMQHWNVYVPYKEFCRHFDGYGHTSYKVSNNACPALDIPKGFFDNNIKISNTRKDGYTCLDITNPNYYAYNVNGADYKWTIDQIPEFWKSRISEIEEFDLPENIDELKMQVILNIAYSNCYTQPPHLKNKLINEIFPKILKAYEYV